MKDISCNVIDDIAKMSEKYAKNLIHRMILQAGFDDFFIRQNSFGSYTLVMCKKAKTLFPCVISHDIFATNYMIFSFMLPLVCKIPNKLTLATICMQDQYIIGIDTTDPCHSRHIIAYPHDTIESIQIRCDLA